MLPTFWNISKDENWETNNILLEKCEEGKENLMIQMVSHDEFVGLTADTKLQAKLTG